jgi:RimJ/RimL family protein N-acetyltransferase
MTEPTATAVLATSRLTLRRLSEDDDAFILGLLNEPSFLRFVGDKGVRTLDDARAYIRAGPMASYQLHGFGLYLVASRDTGESMGICGLLRRDWLDAPDLGFSLLPAYWSRGYAFEAAIAVLRQAESEQQIRRVLAITDPDNADSIRLLGRLGFAEWKRVQPPEGREQLSLFVRETGPT